MLARVGTHARPLRAQHQRNPFRPQCFAQCRLCFTGKANAPEAGLGNFFQRAGKIDDPHPGHPLQRTRSGLGQSTAFRRGMAILRHDGDRAKGGGGAQYGTDIMGIGDLVQH